MNVSHKLMSVCDTDIDVAGAIMFLIALSWPEDPPPELVNLPHQIAADMAYLRKQSERATLTTADLSDIMSRRPYVNHTLYRLFRARTGVPQILYVLSDSGIPEMDVQSQDPAVLHGLYEVDVPVRRPPGRPRIMTRAEMENTVFTSNKASRNIRRRLPREDV